MHVISQAGGVRRWMMPAGALFLLAVTATAWWWRAGTSSGNSRGPVALETAATAADFDALRPRVDAFCGACHAVPAPETFPRDAWYDEVLQGYNFYYASLRSDLDPPPIRDVVAFYREQAPATLDVPVAAGRLDSSPVRFRREAVPLPAGHHSPSISHVRWLPPADDRLPHGELLFCDMQRGDVARVLFDGAAVTRAPGGSRLNDGSTPQVNPLARLAHPAHVEPIDLEGDGRPGYVVAELGSFQPADHENGKVVWLRPNEKTRGYDPVVLMEGLGRVADVRAVDFTGNGQLDLVVAEFGWRKTGRILLLERNGQRDGIPQFDLHVVDERHGAIHVPVADLDGDGRPDFVALISQEHETIIAYLNRGNGTFEQRVIFEARDPAYGSTGIQLVDLDGDGDLDVLYTNGDTLDSHYLKPYHSVQWLENRGEYPFARHQLATMPGVYRAVAADLDGDGDLDIVACAYIPGSLLQSEARGSYDSLIWLEQAAPGAFVRHVLDRKEAAGAMALEVGDFNGDGRLDLAVGTCTSPTRPLSEWLTIWWNEGRAGKPDRAARGRSRGSSGPP